MGGDEPLQDQASESNPSVRGKELTAHRNRRMTGSEAETFRTTFDSETEPADMAIVSAVAAISNTDPKEMDPLHGVINTDALNTFIRASSDTRVTLPYTGFEVVVRSDGVITVAPDAVG